jgi:hypothetical protein
MGDAARDPRASGPPLDPALEKRRAAVAAAVREAGLDPSYALSIEVMLDEDESSWGFCCGSSCDPCVLVLAHAAREARRRIEADP